MSIEELTPEIIEFILHNMISRKQVNPLFDIIYDEDNISIKYKLNDGDRIASLGEVSKDIYRMYVIKDETDIYIINLFCNQIKANEQNYLNILKNLWQIVLSYVEAESYFI